MKMQMTGQMKMEQRMKLAPRMIQSMEILQLPLLALQEKIEAELNSNPVLEQVEERDDEQPGGDDGVEDAGDNRDDEFVVKDDDDNVEDFQRLDSISDTFDDYMERASRLRRNISRGSGDSDKKQEALQNTAAGQCSLHEKLTEQWRLVDTEPLVMEAGFHIIDYIDDKGYLTVRLEQLQNKDKYPFGLDHLEEALGLIQNLDPAGVGARSLKECLLIQMRQRGEDMTFEQILVENHLDDLIENRLPQIAKKMNCSLEDINEAISRMSKLDTSPGLQVGRDDNHPITADVVVEHDSENDDWVVSLRDTSIPNLRVNNFYSKMAKSRKVDQKTREFLQQNIRSAQWLMDAIVQRKNTLLKVATAVVRHQREFFEKGKLYLKPLPMQKIADEVGVHIATVSRAVAGKYIQSPQGILSLRSFFAGGTETDDGEDKSWDAVKAKLEQIVENEDKSKPLSDDQIRQKLNEAGIKDIARRTVAKYRKLMNIPAARFRKKY
jgi:RNA polymerase sigma-54 factor